MKDKKGFTLTELLAVIVLIGVILAIAVPSYQSYVTRTRKEVLESYKANIIDAANQYAAKCFQENKLGECKENEKIWDEIKTNLKNGDDKIPNLKVKERNFNIGKYGLMRLDYLKSKKKPLYEQMKIKDILAEHLLEIDTTAEMRVNLIMKELIAQENITENLKMKDPMKWTGLMNNLKNQAEEIVIRELIFN